MAKITLGLIKKALMALGNETGLTGKARPGPSGVTVDITGPGMAQRAVYFPIMENVTMANLGAIAYRFKEEGRDRVLITDYVSPEMAQRMRAADIQFLDLSGNAYLNAPPLYVMVKGNRRIREASPRVQKSRAFQTAGTKVVYALLRNPELQKAPLRKISEASGVSLGSVSTVLNNLENLKFLVHKGRLGLQLMRNEQLLLRWAAAYAEVLRPKLVLGRYTARDKGWWRDAVLPDATCWGGEVAAAKATGYLTPEIITLYTHAAPGRLPGQFRLSKDPDGEIEILKAFWQREDSPDGDTAHPIVIYGDLLATADSRNLETAQKIYEDKIHKHIG